MVLVELGGVVFNHPSNIIGGVGAYPGDMCICLDFSNENTDVSMRLLLPNGQIGDFYFNSTSGAIELPWRSASGAASFSFTAGC